MDFKLKIQRSLYELKSRRNSRDKLGTLECDEIWLTSSLLHLIAKENEFPAKKGQEIWIPFENGIWIDFTIVWNLDFIFIFHLWV
jgi:hypothetical protein